jgi:hypothetical protein
MFNSDVGPKVSNSGRQIESSQLSESAERQMTHSGIGFDGRYYRYKQYRYDLLSDAVSYAQLDASRPASRMEPDVYPQWAEVDQPAEAERQTMADLNITFDGKLYQYGEYRYENFADAISYAKLERRIRS